MANRIPADAYVANYDPRLDHHRIWLKAALQRLERHDPDALQSGPLRDIWTSGPTEPPVPPVNPDQKWTLKPTDPFTTYLTPNFQYGEITLWDERRRFRSADSLKTARRLCEFLEAVRMVFRQPVIITSGHRPEPINSQLGGARNSEHTFYAPGVGAVDVALERGNQYELQKWIDTAWPYSMGYGAPYFVHVGMRGDSIRRRWHY